MDACKGNGFTNKLHKLLDSYAWSIHFAIDEQNHGLTPVGIDVLILALLIPVIYVNGNVIFSITSKVTTNIGLAKNCQIMHTAWESGVECSYNNVGITDQLKRKHFFALHLL